MIGNLDNKSGKDLVHIWYMYKFLDYLEFKNNLTEIAVTNLLRGL